MSDLPVCPYCNVQVSEDETPCQNATQANGCWCHPSQRAKSKLQVVGPDFKRIEDDPVRLRAMQRMINDGVAWHPEIDQDGCHGRDADDLIARGLCKPPRSKAAKQMRDNFHYAVRAGFFRQWKAAYLDKLAAS